MKVWSYFANAFRSKIYSLSNLRFINTKNTIRTIRSNSVESRIAEIRVTRHGTYGGLQQDWTTGYPANAQPPGYGRGTLTPDGGTLVMANAVESDLIQVLVRT